MRPWNPLAKAHSKKQVWDNRSLVELAAWLACHAPQFLEQFDAIPGESLQGYWQASRRRWECWMRTLKAYPSVAEHATAADWVGLWNHMRAVAAEVLATEPLTRLWGAMLVAGATSRGTDATAPIAHCVLSNHTAVVDYVLNLLDHAPHVPPAEAAELKHLHFHSRRWSDLLLASLIDHGEVEPFAVDAQRSAEFYASYFNSPTEPEVFWRLFATSVRLFFRRYALQEAASTDENRDIVHCILACLPQELLRTDRPQPEPAGLNVKPHARSTRLSNRRGRLDGLV